MCGRTCCTLSPEAVPASCTFVTKVDQVPCWAPDNEGKERYQPSTNIAPTNYTPVLTSGDDGGPPLLRCMMWGLVPPWYKGDDPTKHGLSTINARVEGVATSKLYKPALVKGQTCVVICDGFYEWKQVGERRTKQPYLIYMNQGIAKEEGKATEKKNVFISNQSCESMDSLWDEEARVYKGQRPLFMAGIYSRWHNPQSEEVVLSYSILTKDSKGVLDWLHQRMPVILPDEEAVSNWLNFSLPNEEVLQAIGEISPNQLSFHPVSRAVGNTKDKSSELMLPVDLDEDKSDKATKQSALLMSNWLRQKKSDM